VTAPPPHNSSDVADIVQRAVAVLEEELAAPPTLGPTSPMPTETVRPSIPSSPGQAIGASALAQLVEAIASFSGSRAPEEKAVFRTVASVQPGHRVEIRLGVVNDQQDAVRMDFTWTDLVGEGAHIPAEHMTVVPREVVIQPGASADVLVRVDVPPETRHGVYKSLLRASAVPDLEAIVTVEIQQSA